MGVFIVIIWNVIVFILSIVLRLALYSAKLTLSMMKVPTNMSAGTLMKNIKSKDKDGLSKASALAGYMALKSFIALLNLLIIVVDILLFILSTLGVLLGAVVSLLIIVVIVAGAYIIILNDCSVSSSTSSTSTQQVENSSREVGSSETAGMGTLSEEAKSWANDWEVTYIGDSLGAGSQQFFTSRFANSVYDSDPSRGLISIKGQSTGETAIQTLKRLSSEGKIKSNLVVAIGTNNDMSTDALQQFYNEIPSSVKTITWVLTASEGGVDNSSINSTIKNFVNSHDNMRYLDWKTFVDNNGGWSSYQGGDNIHMSNEGYSKYVDFQTQGLYDLYGKAGSPSITGSASRSEKDYLSSLYNLARSNVSKALDMHVMASEEDSTKEKKGCNYSTSKVSTNQEGVSSSSGGVSLAKDGTGSHGQSIPAGWGLSYSRETLPEELKEYAIDPESIGMVWGAPWEGNSSSVNSGGWINFTNAFGPEWAGQCTELSATFIYNFWDKGGERFINAQGNGEEVTAYVSQKLDVPISQTPSQGAVFSSAYRHTGIVSHVFENGDILIIEQNTKLSGNTAKAPNTWNYRLISKSSLGTEAGNGFVSPATAGYSINPNARSMKK